MMAAALVAFLAAQPAAAAPPTVVSSREVAIDLLGNCVTRDGRAIDLHRVAFLDDRPLVFDAPGGPYRAWIEGQKLLVENPAREIYFNRIDYQVAADGGGDLDLEVRLALVEGRLAVYWRETYRNRTYRQGLYTIAARDLHRTGEGVTYLCAGSGGIRVDD